MINYVVQVNGKVRGTLLLPAGTSEKDVLLKAKESQNIKKYLSKNKILKEIYIPEKLVNFVVK